MLSDGNFFTSTFPRGFVCKNTQSKSARDRAVCVRALNNFFQFVCFSSFRTQSGVNVDTVVWHRPVASVLCRFCAPRGGVCVCNRRSSSPIQEKIKLHNTYNKLKCDGTLSAPTQIIIHTKHHIILLYLGYARRCGVPARAHASIH